MKKARLWLNGDSLVAVNEAEEERRSGDGFPLVREQGERVATSLTGAVGPFGHLAGGRLEGRKPGIWAETRMARR